jgi:hypothetical protein
MKVYFTRSADPRLASKLDTLIALVEKRGTEMADLLQAFSDLKAKVAAQADVDNSVLALVQGLRNQLQSLATQETIDPADVQALADQLATDQAALVDAVSTGLTPPAKISSITDGVDAPGPVVITEPVVEQPAPATDPIPDPTPAS